jgi:integrase
MGKSERSGGIGSATVEPIRTKKDLAAIKAVLADQPRDLCLFILGINLGLRGSDLLSLCWHHVLSPEGRIVSVLEVRESKTGKVRRIALNGGARKALQTWQDVTGDVTPEDYLFPSRKRHGCRQGRMTIQRLHQLVNDWCSRAGLKGHFGSHTLRKTFGYWHRKNGVDLALLMNIFGHSSEAVTARYIGLRQEMIDEANLKLDL